MRPSEFLPFRFVKFEKGFFVRGREGIGASNHSVCGLHLAEALGLAAVAELPELAGQPLKRGATQFVGGCRSGGRG